MKLPFNAQLFIFKHCSWSVELHALCNGVCAPCGLTLIMKVEHARGFVMIMVIKDHMVTLQCLTSGKVNADCTLSVLTSTLTPHYWCAPLCYPSIFTFMYSLINSQYWCLCPSYNTGKIAYITDRSKTVQRSCITHLAQKYSHKNIVKSTKSKSNFSKWPKPDIFG